MEIPLAVEEEKGRSMKGGEQVNIHIIIRKGIVVAVYDMEHPEIGDIRLWPEFHYKVEYLDDYEHMGKEGN
jgi:hypothetical protein